MQEKKRRHERPCPFCGSLDIGFVVVPPYYYADGNLTMNRAMACIQCGSHGPAATTDAVAVNGWNAAAEEL